MRQHGSHFDTSGRESTLQIAENYSKIFIGQTNFTEFVSTTQSDLSTLQQEHADLQKEFDELKEMFLELYYAPGNPGYLKAQKSFEKQKSSESSEAQKSAEQ